MFYNWIRVQDAQGNHYDVREDAVLDEGVTVVDNYPAHRSQTARPGKSHMDLRVEQSAGYSAMTVVQLEAEIGRRVEDGREISPASHRKADLIVALEADDTAVLASPDSSDNQSDTGENHQTEAGSTGQESE